jgi:phosphoadenosine phosphosulfate reductase
MLGDHKIVVLHFSGGKDSLATLYLMRPHWDDITVMWCNTGDAFPETRLQMDAIKQMVPHFIEVKSDQPAQTARNGYPSDALSAWDAPLGVAFFEGRPYRAQSPLGCCMENIWNPTLRATRMLGATLVIRGQRNSEALKSNIRSGHVEDGVEYLFPIEDWTEEQVRTYLQEQSVPLPPHYTYTNSSLDCQHCTGYLFEPAAAGRFVYLRNKHPELHKDVVRRVRDNTMAVAWETRHAQAILAEHYSE